MIKAEIIADSKNQFGQRLTTFVVVFPRIVLAEFNTHRMLSRNSASSRAIPFEKMLKMVEENPFIPIKWMKDHKGMQGNVFFEGLTCGEAWGELDRAFNYSEIKDSPAEGFLVKKWLEARDEAVMTAKSFAELNVTKQIINRLLEPFMWHTVIVTGSEWENFFALRAHPAAEIHIADLAQKMLDAYNSSTPKTLVGGEWHIPFGDRMDDKRLVMMAPRQNEEYKANEDGGEKTFQVDVKDLERLKVKIAIARCARVSYMNFDGTDDYEKDIQLHDNLASMGHWSPFEHCAAAMTDDQYELYASGLREERHGEKLHKRSHHGWCGNFRGFIQYRKMFENENRTDDRVLKK